ncbi:MAG: outer membrane lipoprotein-sorting protein, partial [Thermodesulfobacteriota bacterium]|nr:outer membrane lipoprotein-sorting protein [Thermodesulfobacteriota bacterium]
IKGFSMIRVRYEDIYKPDDVYSYVPAIRRIRRLTGADVTDPMLGSDICYDDFETFRQKINPDMSFKILEIKDFLVPCHYGEKPKENIKENIFQSVWEVRPVWLLEINTNDPNYAYSRRILYLDKEDGAFECHSGENYDQKGRLWRTNGPILWARDCSTSFNCWFSGLYLDQLSGHSTLMDMQPELKNPHIPESKYSVRALLKEAK